jgi:hypothetical protein
VKPETIIARAAVKHDAARTAFHAALISGRREGLSWRQLAAASGLSQAGVRKIVERGES